MASQASVRSATANGRYSLHREFAVGGMASLHLARQKGAGGFQRVVAVKRLHPHFARDPGFCAMFLDEARMLARIRHPNVVPVIDVVAEGEELLLVMEYVHGETLAKLMQTERESDRTVPAPIAASIMVGALNGLHAAHEARDETGRPMNVVHRDVSPHNLLVGVEGIARVLDFGVAKSSGRVQHTEEGQIKGKVAYMAPEQLDSAVVSRRTDVFAAGVILWELVTGRRLIEGPSPVHQAIRVLNKDPVAPGELVPGVPPVIDAIVLRALQRDPEKRFATARDMATALEFAIRPASARAVGEYVSETAREAITRRERMIREVEGQVAGAGRLRSMISIPDADVFEDTGPDSSVAVPESIVPAANTVAPPAGTRGASAARPGGRPVRSAWSAVAVLLLSLAAMSPGFVHGRPAATPAAANQPAARSAAVPLEAEPGCPGAQEVITSAASGAAANASNPVAKPSAPASAPVTSSAATKPVPARRAIRGSAPVPQDPEPVWPPAE